MNIFSSGYPHRGHLLVIVPALLAALAAGMFWGFHFPGDLFATARAAHPIVTMAGKWLHDYNSIAFVLLVVWLFYDAWRRNDKDQARFLICLVVVFVIVNNGLVWILKTGFGMPRPGMGDVAVHWSSKGAFHSFPSGTTCRLLGFIIPFALYFHKAWVTAAFSLLGLVVVASRFWMGRHHPVDILGALVVGLAGAYAVFALYGWFRRSRERFRG